MSRVSVIIATTCEARRWDSLCRAIESVQAPNGSEVAVVVVVNGQRFDPDCLAELRNRQDLRVEYLEEGSLPAALRHGRSVVGTPFFAFLDDDDEYLEGAIRSRLQPMLDDPGVDFVVTNGYHRVGGQDASAVTDVAAVLANPLRALLRENWLASCGGLFRSERISAEYFDGRTKYYEWTLLAYKLAASRRMVFVDAATYRINDSPGSLSKSVAFREAEIAVLRQIMDLGLPPDVIRGLRAKMGRAYHGLSNYHRQEGHPRLAWRYHLASLGFPEGYRFLAYSRRLLPFYPRD